MASAETGSRKSIPAEVRPAARSLLYALGLARSTRKERQRLHRRIYRYRRYLSALLYERFGGVVAYGPMKGFKLAEHSDWGAGDIGPMLLGLYEKEVLEAIVVQSRTRDTLVNLGAGDGYFGVGLVKSGFYDSSICFEISETSRGNLRRVAAENGVADRVTVLGAAEADLPRQLAEIGADPKRCAILCDVEGFEFTIFSPTVLEALNDAVILVEIHDFQVAKGDERYAQLRSAAAAHFRLTELHTGSRDPSAFPELHEMNDIDRWLICDEGRPRLMTWLQLEPK